VAVFFGSIPHADLLKSVARRIVDRRVLYLIKMWLGIVNLDGRGMLVVSVARRLGSEGPLLAYCAAPL